jgi:hypothetical protein
MKISILPATLQGEQKTKHDLTEFCKLAVLIKK